MTALVCDHCQHPNPPDAITCEKCGSSDMRPAGPEPWRYDPEIDGGEGEDLTREQEARHREVMREVGERSKPL